MAHERGILEEIDLIEEVHRFWYFPKLSSFAYETTKIKDHHYRHCSFTIHCIGIRYFAKLRGFYSRFQRWLQWRSTIVLVTPVL